MRSVPGLSLLRLEHATLRGTHLLAKEVLDRIVTAVLLVVLAPVLVGCALALRLEEIGFQSPIFSGGATPSLIASVLGVFWSCGLVENERIESAMVLARLPCAIGEGLAQRAGHFKKYPMRLPDYQYGDGDE